MKFSCDNPRSRFALRIYVEGVNVITGEPTILKRETGTRDHKKQDYIVVPQQESLIGIATSPGMVKRFVPVPYEHDYSIEHPVSCSSGNSFQIYLLKIDNRENNFVKFSSRLFQLKSKISS